MPTESITIAALTTVGGIAVATTLIDKLIWTTTGAADAVTARFGPIVAVATGIVLGVGAGLLLGVGGPDLAQDGINGFLGGLSAIGLYDVATSKAGLTA